MPIKKSAKKYARTTKKKTARNKLIKGSFRSLIKKTKMSAKAGQGEEAGKWLKMAFKALDKAAQKGVIKKNAAARKKSRLNKMVKSIAKK